MKERATDEGNLSRDFSLKTPLGQLIVNSALELRRAG